MAVGGAYPKPPWRYCPDALMTHEAFDAATAHHIPPGAQGRVDPGRAIAAAMCHMDPPDLGQQGAIGRLAQTFRPAAPGIIPRRRDTHHIAHDANRERLALVRDEAEFHLGASEKMRSVFFRISRSMRRRSFSRRRRAFSAAKSAPASGGHALRFGGTGDPALAPTPPLPPA